MTTLKPVAPGTLGFWKDGVPDIDFFWGTNSWSPISWKGSPRGHAKGFQEFGLGHWNELMEYWTLLSPEEWTE